LAFAIAEPAGTGRRARVTFYHGWGAGALTASISIAARGGSATDVPAEAVWRISHGMPDAAGDRPTLIEFDGGQVETDDALPQVLTALAGENVALVRLTTPSVAAVYINPSWVTAIGDPEPAIDAPNALTVVLVAGQRQPVVESASEVLRALGVQNPSGPV